MGPLVRLVAKGIGIAREAAAARHEKSSTDNDKSDNPDFPLNGNRHTEGEHVIEQISCDLEADSAADAYGERESRLAPGSEPGVGKSLDPSHEAQNFHDDDEEDWYLDDAAGEFDDLNPPPSYSTHTNSDQLADPYNIPFDKEKLSRLPYPVLIPQRRPRDRSRGFVRAYAPDLAACGVDQDSFLKFITDFYHASKVYMISPLLGMACFGSCF
jgi:hypothetical protein